MDNRNVVFPGRQLRKSTDRLSRREILARALVTGGLLGPTVGGATAASAPPADSHPMIIPGFGRARSVVVVFAHGGQSQIDIWDPKPLAPLDVRGEFAPISTAVPGLSVCEHLPRVAQLLDRCALIRSMSHEDLDHGSAAYLALTGFYHSRRSGNPAPAANDLPTIGALVRRLLPRSDRLAEAVHLNAPALVPYEPAPGQFSGVLGRAHEPLMVEGVFRSEAEGLSRNDSMSGGYERESGFVTGLQPRDQWLPQRLRERWELKRQLDRLAGSWSQSSIAIDLDIQYRQATELLASPEARNVFRVEQEPLTIRERYGLHRSGQSLLLARRLVEAEVPFINVIWNQSNRGQDTAPNDTDQYGWDTHNDIFDALRNRLLPRFDHSFSAFLDDLDQRGLLDQTLVICMGEFGRAPRVAVERNFAGVSPGRKHWPHAYSIVMAGAGVQRGMVLGATDRLGAEPITDRFGPWDVTATVFHALGIDPKSHYLDLLQRPLPITPGRPIAGLFGSA